MKIGIINGIGLRNTEGVERFSRSNKRENGQILVLFKKKKLGGETWKIVILVWH